jgi:hypothetical protein
MPRAKKKVEPQLQVEEQTVSIAGSLVPSTAKFKGASHKRALDVTFALVDSQRALNGKQLSLWAEENNLNTEGVTILRKGIHLRPGARRLFGFFQKKIGKEHIIEDGRALMPTNVAASKPHRHRIGGYNYNVPWISFTPYEAIKDAIGNRNPSKKDYEDFARNFQELQDRWHIFTMNIDTDGNKTKKVELRNRIILDVITESIDNEHGKQYAVSLHPITTAQLGKWFRIYPDDFENQIALKGGIKSPYIWDLAELVLYERDMPGTKENKYFERTLKTLISHLKLEQYAQRRKTELKEMIKKALDALVGYLIEKYELSDKAGGIKYQIWPLFDSVKEIENGAA